MTIEGNTGTTAMATITIAMEETMDTVILFREEITANTMKGRTTKEAGEIMEMAEGTAGIKTSFDKILQPGFARFFYALQ